MSDLNNYLEACKFMGTHVDPEMLRITDTLVKDNYSLRACNQRLTTEKEALRGENTRLYGDLLEAKGIATEACEMLERVTKLWGRIKKLITP